MTRTKNNTNNKRAGEIAEALVHWRLVEQGFDAAFPTGDSATWDLIADWRGKVNRLQIKSTRVKDQNTEATYYIKNAHRGNARAKYDEGDFDFFIAVLPWAIYVIPADVVLNHPRVSIGFWEAERNRKGKLCEWEKYREAWSLLK